MFARFLKSSLSLPPPLPLPPAVVVVAALSSTAAVLRRHSASSPKRATVLDPEVVVEADAVVWVGERREEDW